MTSNEIYAFILVIFFIFIVFIFNCCFFCDHNNRVSAHNYEINTDNDNDNDNMNED